MDVIGQVFQKHEKSIAEIFKCESGLCWISILTIKIPAVYFYPAVSQ